MHLERICILLLLGEVFYKCQLGQIDCYILIISLLIFGLVVLSVIERAALMPPSIIVDLSIHPCVLSAFFFIFLENF